MTITKTLAAGFVATSLAFAPVPAQAKTSSNEGLVFTALFVGAVALLIGTQMMAGGGATFSSKDIKGTDGAPIPGSPSVSKRQVITDF